MCVGPFARWALRLSPFPPAPTSVSPPPAANHPLPQLSCFQLSRRIRWLITAWDSRFGASQPVPHSDLPQSSFVRSLPPPPLAATDWVWQACDFHCSNILQRFAAEHPGKAPAPEAFRELMWDHASSVNTRAAAFENPKPKRPEEGRRRWEAVEAAVARMAYSIIRSQLR